MQAELQRAMLPHLGTEIPHSVGFSLCLPSTFRKNLPNSTSRMKPLEIRCNNSQKVLQPAIITSGYNVRFPEMSFKRLQATDEDHNGMPIHEFSEYICREAVSDVEYWAAAWLRAESLWESGPPRHVHESEWIYAYKEFETIKEQCAGLQRNLIKCYCLVAVRKEEGKDPRSVSSSVVGTLDFCIRYNAPVQDPAVGARFYGYIANVCVAKSARRQGIATNLLHLATDIAIASGGLQHLFVRVNADNEAAQELYTKQGFKFVTGSVSPIWDDDDLLLMWKKI